jgi:hypothetical protein
VQICYCFLAFRVLKDHLTAHTASCALQTNHNIAHKASLGFNKSWVGTKWSSDYKITLWLHTVQKQLISLKTLGGWEVCKWPSFCLVQSLEDHHLTLAKICNSSINLVYQVSESDSCKPLDEDCVDVVFWCKAIQTHVSLFLKIVSMLYADVNAEVVAVLIPFFSF